MWIIRRAAVVCALLAALPAVLFLLGSTISTVFSCNINEPCFAFGIDVGWLAGKLQLLSIPALMLAPPAVLVTAGWFIAEIVHAWRGP